MKKNKTKIKINNKTNIIVVSMIFVLLVSFVVYNLNDNKKLIYDEDEINTLFSNFGQCASGYELLFNNKGNLEFKDLTKEFINNTLYNYLNYYGKIDSNKSIEVMSKSNPKIDSFTKDDLEDAVKSIYGDVDYKINDTFDLGDYKFNYNTDEKKYISIRESQINCKNNEYDGYIVNSINVEDDKLNVEIIYYKYKLEVNEKGCFRMVYFGTKDSEQFTNNNDPNIVKDNKDHFLVYKFVFVPDKNKYVFNHIERVI